MENKTRRIGNDEGLSLMENLDKQLERIPRLEKQLAKQEELAKTRNRAHWQVRVAELERLITTPNAKTRFNQNANVHGADVFNDYEALKNMD